MTRYAIIQQRLGPLQASMRQSCLRRPRPLLNKQPPLIIRKHVGPAKAYRWWRSLHQNRLRRPLRCKAEKLVMAKFDEHGARELIVEGRIAAIALDTCVIDSYARTGNLEHPKLRGLA